MIDRPENLDALLADPASVPIEQIPAAIGELEKLKAALWARLVVPASASNGGEDRLLDVAEAAERLGVTKDWLRRRPELPFVKKLSEGVVRYSVRQMDRWLGTRRGA